MIPIKHTHIHTHTYTHTHTSEANAIMHCAILGIVAGTGDAILYTTFVPCLECTKMAITIGIKKVVCLDSYPETDYDLIKEAKMEVITLDKNKIQHWAEKIVNGK